MKKLVLVLCLCFLQIPAMAEPPAEWHENDWVKFIDAAVWESLSQAYTKSGGRFPLVEVYSAISASGSAVKPGLQMWLRRKIADAYTEGDFTQGDRYNAFYACLTWGSCEELRAIEKSGAGGDSEETDPETAAAGFAPELSTPWSSNYGDIHWQEGWYGNPNNTITPGSRGWDEHRGLYVIEGTWGRKNRPDYKGGFEFVFESPCSFTGKWWYSGSQRGSVWRGSCGTE